MVFFATNFYKLFKYVLPKLKPDAGGAGGCTLFKAPLHSPAVYTAKETISLSTQFIWVG